MFFPYSTYIGIDPTAGGKPFTFAALDHDLNLLGLGRGDMEEILAFVAGQQSAIVAVCGPQKPNTGVMNRPEVRDRLSPRPKPGRWGNFRLPEYQLRQHNITMPRTPAKEEACPAWMRKSFTLFRRLKALNFNPYPDSDSSCLTIEVYPHACFTVLLGHVPLPKRTLDGRLQRQLLLYELRVGIKDPLLFFEEITRHKLLQGNLPYEMVHTTEELDALAGAYTAWLTSTKPSEISPVGDSEEGLLILPISELKRRYEGFHAQT